MKQKLYLICGLVILFSSCTVIRQGEVGVKRRLGKIDPEYVEQGPKGYNIFTTAILKVPTRIMNIEVKPDLPSKEGLTIRSEISILYRIKPEAAPKIVQNIGLNYESEVILPVFRSASADITSKFLAKDMHSGERAQIENAIRKQMTDILEPRGFVIDNVLMKSIRLPEGLARTIEEKLQAEQDAQRMEFVKEREKRDAERRIIEAEGKKEIARIQAEGEKNAAIIQAEARKKIFEIEAEGKANAVTIEAMATRKANDTINKTLTPSILKLRQIEAFRMLSNSNNSKLVITDGKTPFLTLPDKF
ncbi:prohibitin family protein [Sediminibacterium salmoneum]|uniref:prohibitin family protein n=1 Tax=Sediminibacterium salmoneum TaxID=426421 RepID=UPI00047A655C|nr:prohibitin family protein [Sediminibacterium salmoneum]